MSRYELKLEFRTGKEISVNCNCIEINDKYIRWSTKNSFGNDVIGGANLKELLFWSYCDK